MPDEKCISAILSPHQSDDKESDLTSSDAVCQ